MTSSEMKRAEGIMYLWRGASVYAELAQYGGGALSRSIAGVAGPPRVRHALHYADAQLTNRRSLQSGVKRTPPAVAVAFEASVLIVLII